MKGPGYRDTIGNGWGTNGPAIDFMQRASDASDRVAGGVQGTFRPSSIFTVNGLIGMDRANRNDEKLLREQDLIGLKDAFTRSGRGRSQNQTTNRNASLTGTASLPVRADLQSRSVMGVQFQRMDYASMGVEVQDLQQGSDVLSGGTVIPSGATEVLNALATLGWFADQSVSLRDALFVTAALRSDVASSFGTEARQMVYPKFNASWLVSQESFFPSTSYLTSLRFRGAFGQAGVQPGTDARFRSFGSVRSNFDGIQVTGFGIRSLGNTELVPERSIEYEVGFDLSLWNDRMTFDVTRYQKTTNDALVVRTLPPSFGFPSRQENVGRIRNSGLEILTSARPFVSTAANWNVTLAYSNNTNKLMKLSTNSTGVQWGGMRYVEGYPVNAFWARPIVAYNDTDGNGILTQDEIKLADSSVYIGQTVPKMELSLHSDLGLMNGRVTIGTGFNYQGGSTQYNSMLSSQCIDKRCRFAVDRGVSLAEQLYAVSTTFAGNNNAQVAYDRVSWMRWSDLSVTVHGTPEMARMFRGRTVSFSVMGRNLALWSKYRGADPEVNTSNLGNFTADGGAIPQTREWSIRFNLSY
jgi:outer membrane receptor protein involved in Fe transport